MAHLRSPSGGETERPPKYRPYFIMQPKRRTKQHKIELAEERFQTLVSNIPGAVYRCRRSSHNGWRIEYISQFIEDIAGQPASNYLGRHIETYSNRIHPDDKEKVREAIHTAIGENVPFNIDYRIHHADGGVRWIHEQGRPIWSRERKQLWLDGVLFDVTYKMKTEALLNHLAYHDDLTDLPNRTLFLEQLRSAMTVSRRGNYMVALLLMGLEKFKRINDTLGHTLGDRLLQGVAYRLTKTLYEMDIVTRIGGDEFAVVLPKVFKTQDAVTATDKIFSIFKSPFVLGGHELFMNCTIGISFYPEDGKDPETLLKHAVVAMERAKGKGWNNYSLYSSAMDTNAMEQLKLESELMRALERAEMEVYYQPFVDLETEQIVGSEALVRWRHPERGVLLPEEFLHLAERTGLMVPIGEWVLRTACRQAGMWQRANGKQIHVAVNLSARQFHNPNLVAAIGSILADTGLDPTLLELELTENIVMENVEEAVETLNALTGLGLKISIDDFGTGYSSLGSLRSFPITTLKIDRSFVKEIAGNRHGGRSIVEAIISMAKSLRLDVIAEGVESEPELAFLRSQRCNKMQGFLYSKPVPAEAFGKLLTEKT